MSLFSGRAQSKLAPNVADIRAKDDEVYERLLGMVANVPQDDKQLALILATGLSEIHARLGDMWAWDKAGRG